MSDGMRKSCASRSRAADQCGLGLAGGEAEDKFSARPQPEPYEIPSVRLPTSPAPQSGGYGVNKRNVPPAIPYVGYMYGTITRTHTVPLRYGTRTVLAQYDGIWNMDYRRPFDGVGWPHFDIHGSSTGARISP